MSEIRIFHTPVGKIKPMHAVNNGPKPFRGDQTLTNFNDYKALRLPYARNHDASFFAPYGGEHTVDVHAIFADFNADPYDPASYDFRCTDAYTQSIIDAGTEVYYRLGSKIEHGVKKVGTVVPPDFQKWAVICEHIIRHYTEGWANGFHHKITYWEIWNEPDLYAVRYPEPTPCWQGSEEQFQDLFLTAVRHLKKCFPHLKIGGPASCGWYDWCERFLARMQKEGLPLDFFSWHVYTTDPYLVAELCRKYRALLDKYGYTETESILNEWNHVIGWTDRFKEAITYIIGPVGAAFSASVMSLCQDAPLDLLMYYDARPCAFCGLFDFYTMKPLNGYYPFLYFSDLYTLGTQLKTEIAHDRAPGEKGTTLTATAATDGKTVSAMISTYCHPDHAKSEVELILHPDFPVTEATLRATTETGKDYLLPMQEKDGTYRVILPANGVYLFSAKR